MVPADDDDAVVMMVMVPPEIAMMMMVAADANVHLRDLNIVAGLRLRLVHRSSRIGGLQERYGIRDRIEQLGVGLSGRQRARSGRRRGRRLRGAVE